MAPPDVWLRVCVFIPPQYCTLIESGHAARQPAFECITCAGPKATDTAICLSCAASCHSGTRHVVPAAAVVWACVCPCVSVWTRLRVMLWARCVCVHVCAPLYPDRPHPYFQRPATREVQVQSSPEPNPPARVCPLPPPLTAADTCDDSCVLSLYVCVCVCVCV